MESLALCEAAHTRAEVKTFYCRKALLYDGSAIESHWAYRTFGIDGDSIVAFQGACDIPWEKMIDLEDLLARSPIYSRRMLHFIVERFDRDLDLAIHVQRLLAVIVKEELEESVGRRISRVGDDLFDGKAKLTISIATLTPVSSKIHLGINIVSEGTPVKTKGLRDYGVAPVAFAKGVISAFAGEVADILRKKSHVRGAP